MDDNFTDEDRRANALDFAIKADCGTDYNDNGLAIINPDILINAAKKFEAYLKGKQNAQN